MSIVQNIACPECQANNHDRTSAHLMVFADGAMFCNRSHLHKSRKTFYVPPNGDDPILSAGISGKIKYTVEQYNSLKREGKLDNPTVRAVAIGGMRNQDAYTVMNDKERAAIEAEWALDVGYFGQLKFKNLVSRGIKGPIAKFYGVRVGLDSNQQVERHYYPRFDDGKQVGAKCRTLPKDFHLGTLGRMWGDGDLFGMNTIQTVIDAGRRQDTLILTGGECDAMAAQQMLMMAQEGTKYAGQWYHIWSGMKGELAIKEIIHNKEAINRFKRVLVAYDDDEVGNKMCMDVARLFRGKTMKIQMPQGCKDANDCLMNGRHKEFVEAFWKPIEVFQGGTLKRVASLIRDALKTPEMGQSWPWESMNSLTFGIRPHALYVIGAGTGVNNSAV